jgi:transcriptional regulator with XRE-family HTH domain
MESTDNAPKKIIRRVGEKPTKNIRKKVIVHTKYWPEMDNLVMNYMSQGMSRNEIARKLGITVGTLYKWEKDEDKKSFAEALRIGDDACKAWWEKIGRENVVMEGRKNPGRKFNTTLWIFNMINRFKWVNATKVETSMDITQNERESVADKYTPEDRTARVLKILQGTAISSAEPRTDPTSNTETE